METATLIKVFINMRTAKTKLAAAQKAEMDVLTSKMDIIATELKKRVIETGGDSIKSKEYGTASIVTNVKAGCSDWDVFVDFLKENDFNPLMFLDKKIKASAVTDYMEEHEGKLPPGVTIYKDTALRITKPSSK